MDGVKRCTFPSYNSRRFLGPEQLHRVNAMDSFNRRVTVDEKVGCGFVDCNYVYYFGNQHGNRVILSIIGSVCTYKLIADSRERSRSGLPVQAGVRG